MDLADALGDKVTSPGQQQGGAWPGGQQGQGGAWPGGQQGQGGAWPGGQQGQGGAWPGGQQGQGGANPAPPSWPAGGNKPAGGPEWPKPGGGQPGGTQTWPGSSSPSAPPAQRLLAIPHNVSFFNGVYDKFLITIQGTVRPSANMITIDLTTSNDDLALHINPRFNEYGKQVVVRNSRIRGKWGSEERELQRGFPFKDGRNFEMKILCTRAEFKVAVDGNHLFNFEHRLTDLGSIKHLSIYNDLTLSSVTTDMLA